MALFKSLCAPKKHTINFYHTSNWTTVPVIDNVYGFKTGQTLLVLQYTNYMLKSFKLCYLEVCRAEIFLKALILFIKYRYIMFMELNYVKKWSHLLGIPTHLNISMIFEVSTFNCTSDFVIHMKIFAFKACCV